MFYTTEEIRQKLAEDPNSYYSRAIAFTKEELKKAGKEDFEPNVPLTECCYHYMTTNEQGNPMVMGVPCWLYAMRESDEERLWATFAIWTNVDDLSVTIPEIEVIGFYAENAVGQKDHSRLLFCKQEEFAQIRQILQIMPVKKKKTNHLSLVVDNANTVEALAESLAPTTSLTRDKLIDLLKDHVSTSLMPSSRITKYTHHVPVAIKAADDGDFLRQLLQQAHSGFFHRDALRKGEIYVVLVVSDYTFVIGLKSYFAIVSYKQVRCMDMGEKNFVVDRNRLMEILAHL